MKTTPLWLQRVLLFIYCFTIDLSIPINFAVSVVFAAFGFWVDCWFLFSEPRLRACFIPFIMEPILWLWLYSPLTQCVILTRLRKFWVFLQWISGWVHRIFCKEKGASIRLYLHHLDCSWYDYERALCYHVGVSVPQALPSMFYVHFLWGGRVIRLFLLFWNGLLLECADFALMSFVESSSSGRRGFLTRLKQRWGNSMLGNTLSNKCTYCVVSMGITLFFKEYNANIENGWG